MTDRWQDPDRWARRDGPPRLVDGGGDGPPELGPLLADSVPLSAPPAVTRARVWAAIVRRSSAKPRWPRVLAPLAAASLIALFVFVVARRRETPAALDAMATISGSVGQVEAGPSGGALARAGTGAALSSGSRIRVNAGGRAMLRLADAAVSITGEADATIRRGGLIAGTEIALRVGTLRADVAPRRSSDAFVVQVADVAVRVVGTRFSVAAGVDGAVTVAVEEGTVQVSTPVGRALVEAGSSWSRAGDRRAAAGRPGRPPDRAPPASSPASAPPRLRSVARHAPAVPATASSPQPPASDGEQEQYQRALAPSGADRQREAATASPPPPVRSVVRHAPAAAAPPATAPAPAPPLPASDGEQEQYQRALVLSAADRHREAATLLQELARRGGDRGALALYELGEISRRHLRDPRGAAAAFAAYVAQYPEGPLVQEARLGLIESHLDGRALDLAAGAIAAFLAAHPGSERREEIRLLQAHLIRERDGCRRAVEYYERLASRAGPGAASADPRGEALYFAAACLREAGRGGEARRQLERYLALFPDGRHRREVEQALDGGP